MLGRYGRVGAAIGGLVLWSSALAQQPPDPSEGRQTGAADSQNLARNDASPAALAAIADAVHAIAKNTSPTEIDQTQAADDRERAKQDLKAQQSAARWAFWAFVAAAVQVPLTAIGIALVWRTLRATEAAVAEAESATRAAQEAVTVAQETAHAQLRPYVYIVKERLAVKPIVADRAGHSAIVADTADIIFAIKNFGQTPAKQVRLKARSVIGGHWTEPPPGDLGEAVTTNRADLPPGFERDITGWSAIGLAEVFPAVVLSERAIFFEGRIDYADANGKRYFTEFRRAASGEDAFDGVFIITAEGNEAT